MYNRKPTRFENRVLDNPFNARVNLLDLMSHKKVSPEVYDRWFCRLMFKREYRRGVMLARRKQANYLKKSSSLKRYKRIRYKKPKTDFTAWAYHKL